MEPTDKNGSLFGFKRLCSVVDLSHRSDAEDIMNAILSMLDSYTGGYSQADDITIVVLKKTKGVVLEQ